MASPLYKRLVEGCRDGWMRKIWGPTPWVVSVYSGASCDDRYREIEQWCLLNFGQASCPIREVEGDWRMSGVTVEGMTRVGFREKEAMDIFITRWGGE